jgi:ACS family pantothenate transporter-like MFS transporter
MAVAAAFSGRAKLPSEEQMRREYEERVQSKGLGKKFHNLRGKDAEYVNELLDWVNRDSGEHIPGHSDTWHLSKAAQEERFKMLFEASKAMESAPIVLPACS